MLVNNSHVVHTLVYTDKTRLRCYCQAPWRPMAHVM